MTINEQVKILDDVLSSGELEKYEYLTGEDLGYKPGVVQKAKFEYSPLGQVFNKWLNVAKKLKDF